ncbi:VOC family protein [Spongiivirga citrea]|uniref:VOC family protein n=1 Tax=Spongiivirga citrea TaxID=1481457 RepID=A0A6M0CI38_9FLAO|nr:VOC family protein [Spongiivirga citrea]NER17555.1 VOC family protein [Spongiivirga citrea]
MDLSEFPMPKEGFVVTQFLTVKDAIKSANYYAQVFGGKVLHEGHPSFVKLANTWLILNEGGGPTVDKPDYSLEAPTPESRTFRSFLNIRVADIKECYEEWQKRGAKFLTPPQDMGAEWRSYIKDPDGYIIEVGQAKLDMPKSLSNN